MEGSNFKDLLSKAKSSNSNKTIQKVMPVKKEESKEVQFSFYIEKDLLKKLKLKALNNDTSIKQLITQSIEKYIG